MIKVLPTSLFIILLFPLTITGASIDNLSSYPSYGVLMYFVPSPASDMTRANPSYYYDYSFKSGKITTINNEEIIPDGIRYNISKDLIECKIIDQYCKVSSPHKLKEVEIDGKYYFYKKYLANRDSLSGYLQRLHHGETSLYVRYTSNSIDKFNGKANLQKIFLVEKPGSAPVKVKSVRNAIGLIFEGMNQTANQYMNKHDLDWKDPYALLQLIDYLTDLKESNVAFR